MTLWAHRMASGPAPEMMAFSTSLGYDQRLAPDDVVASLAHVRGLGRTGILTASETDLLVGALRSVHDELAGATFVFLATDEDVHSSIERRVTELAGDVGGKLHTGRSRNDQVATALRLYVRRELTRVAEAVLDLQESLLRRSLEADGAYLPGYTHLQRAQPVPLAHLLLAHGWSLARDVDRLFDATRRANVSPLGAGALAGSSLPLDPDGVASDLSFDRRFENSIDAVSDRDFVAEALFVLTLIGIHLSRLGEEIVIYASEEFGFYVLDDAWSTGSSMLPQKKNPDIAELVRGKAGRLIGDLTGFLATLKGLPLAYNRDLQEDKEPLFDAFDQILRALPALVGLINTMGFNTERMAAAADVPALVAVDLAEWLVSEGMPFREAHGIVGALVRQHLEAAVPLESLVAADPHFSGIPPALFEPGAALERRISAGGGGTVAVAAQLERFVDRLAIDRTRVADHSR